MELEYLSLSFETVFLLALSSFSCGLFMHLFFFYKKLCLRLNSSEIDLFVLDKLYKEYERFHYVGMACIILSCLGINFVRLIALTAYISFGVYLLCNGKKENIGWFRGFIAILFLGIGIVICMVILLLFLSYTPDLNFASSGLGNNLVEVLEISSKSPEVCAMVGDKSGNIAYNAFRVIHAVSVVKNPEVLSFLLHKTLWQENGRSLAFVLNHLLPQIHFNTHSSSDIINTAAKLGPQFVLPIEMELYNKQVVLSERFGISLSEKVVSDYEAFLKAKKLISPKTYFFPEDFGKVSKNINFCSRLILGERFGYGADMINPTKSGEKTGTDFCSIKYANSPKYVNPYKSLDQLQIQELQAGVQLKKAYNLFNIRRTDCDYQGDFFANIGGPGGLEVACEIKTPISLKNALDSSININKIEDYLKGCFGDKGFFSKLDAQYKSSHPGLKCILAIDLSRTTVNSIENFNHLSGVLCKQIDNNLFSKFKRIEVSEEIQYMEKDKIGVIFQHEKEFGENSFSYPALKQEAYDEAIKFGKAASKRGMDFGNKSDLDRYIKNVQVESELVKTSDLKEELEKDVNTLINVAKKIKEEEGDGKL